MEKANHFWSMIEQDINYASQGKRMVNFIIDSFLAGILCVLLFPFLAKSLSFYPKEAPFYNTYFIFQFAYYFLMEGAFKTTIGKLITKTKIINSNGTALNLKGAFIRSVIRLVPFEIYSFANKFPVGWHDSIAGTRVVEKESYIKIVEA